MNAEQLLTYFNRIADAPDAIPRLRRFILDLAVRGKLVEQDPNDEPASELLKRIKQTRDERHKRKLALIGSDPTKTDFDLPDNWDLAPLSALGGWAIGAGFPKSEQGRTEGPYFFLKVSDMNLPGNEKVIVTAQNRIDNEVAARIRVKIHSVRTIIFPKIGGAIATNKRRILGRPSAIDNNCLGITISSEINLNWAYLLLTSLDFTKYQAGTAVPALQQGVLERIPVGIPPLAEQHRITAKVDELMALCDRLETARKEREATRGRLAVASLARLNTPDPDPAVFQNHATFALDNLTPLTTRPDQIKGLRQTILNLAVRGKLVPQDPNDESAAELLKRIVPEKQRLVAEGKFKSLDTTEFNNEVENVPFSIPANWVWCRLDDIAAIARGGSPRPIKAYLTDDKNGINWIKIGDSERGNIYINETKEKIRPDGLKKSRMVFPNDLILSNSMSFGYPYILNIQGCIHDGWLVIRTPASLLDKLFLYNLLLSSYSRNAFSNAAAGAVVQNLNADKVRRLPVPLPPLAEQHRIVTKVDELIALCDRLEAILAAGDETQGRLLDALLHEALEPGTGQEAA